MLKKVLAFLVSPIFIVFLFIVSLALRFISLPAISTDMEAGLFDWYNFIAQRGFALAFKKNFALYSPPYLYLLWLATFIPSAISRVAAIKLISIVFDALSAFFAYKLVALKHPQTRLPWLAAALVFTLPTVILNSSYWGQCDSIYTAFFLGCLYFLMTERPAWAMFCFSLAFAFKLQAIFLLPFLGVYTLRRKIPWWTFPIIPAVYVALSLPTILAGRPWLEVLTIYAHQAEKFPKWSSFTPTLYLPLQGRVDLTPTLSTLVVIGAVILTSIWMLWVWRKTKADTLTSILMTALASVALVPFILPRMHERYFYPQDVISLVAVFFLPELWFIPILSQVISFIAYGPFLFDNNFHVSLFGRNLNALLYIAFPLEAFIVAWILWKQLRGPSA